MTSATSQADTAQAQLSLFQDPCPHRPNQPSTNITAPTPPFRLDNYELIRSRRKTISLVIRNAQLIVRAPMRAPQYWIREVVASKADWIQTQIHNQVLQRNDVIRILDHHSVAINGVEHLLCFRCNKASVHRSIAGNNRRGKLTQDQQIFHFSFPDGAETPDQEALATALFLRWLKENAATLLDQHVQRLCRQHRFEEALKTTRYRMTRSKWGHCTAEGNIQLNPAIALAPEFVRDYVIIHELCHLRHRNHSSNFWNLVANCDPNWKNAERWLDNEGHRVAIGSLLANVEK